MSTALPTELPRLTAACHALRRLTSLVLAAPVQHR
jgi:hypothetical protein